MLLNGIDLHTLYEVDCYRGGVLIWHDSFPNIVVTVGKNKLLDATFKDGIGALAWFVGLVSAASFTAYSAADTMSSHGGWVESTAYSDATRIAYSPDASSAGSMSNTTVRALFTINATATIKGAFLVNQSTKGGTTGTLYGVGSFAANRDVVSGDVLSVKITLTD